MSLHGYPILLSLGQPACVDCVMKFRKKSQHPHSSPQQVLAKGGTQSAQNSMIKDELGEKEREREKVEGNPHYQRSYSQVNMLRRSITERKKAESLAVPAQHHCRKGSYTPSFFAPQARVSQELKEWLETLIIDYIHPDSKAAKTTRLYSAGPTDKEMYTGAKLHELCDNKGALLLAVELEDGSVVGAYTSSGWSTELGQPRIDDPQSALYHVAGGKVTVHSMQQSEVWLAKDGFEFGVDGSELGFSFNTGHLVHPFARDFKKGETKPGTFEEWAQKTIGVKRIEVFQV